VKIVIDGRMLGWTGVGRYTLALLEELPKLDQENQYVVLVRRVDWAKWEPVAANFEKVECNIDPYTVGEQLRLSGILHDLKPE